jgi:TetR/AcrR family transcriptional regulator, mexJK operon transcriptional repressor
MKRNSSSIKIKKTRHVSVGLLGRPKDGVKRESIVRAASTLFFKDGYVLTSMEAVAKKAGVSKLTIYSHFSDKSELFKEVVCQRCDKRAMPDSFMAQAEAPAARTLMHIATHLTQLLFSADSIRLHRIMQAEALHHPEVVQIFYDAGPKRVRVAFGNLLREWNRQGQVVIPDVACATEQFFSLLKGEVMMKTLMMLAPPLTGRKAKNHVRATVNFFLAAYRPKSPKGAS